MQKRLFLAVALSFLVLFVWQSFIIKPQPQVNCPLPAQAITGTTALPTTGAQNNATIEKTEPPVQLTEREFDSALLRMLFVDENAEIKEVRFKKFKNQALLLQDSLYIGNNLVFKAQVSENNTVRYVHEDAQKRVAKEIVFNASGYEAKVSVVVENLTTQPLKISLPIVLGTLKLQQTAANYQDVCVSLPDKIVYPPIAKDGTFSSINFLSLRDSHFCAIIEPAAKNYSAFLKKGSNKETEVGLQSPEFDIAPGQKLVQEFQLYLGPQDLKLLAKINPDWQAVVYFGKLDVIAHLILKGLTGLFTLTKNWGISIIILSIIIYVILFPLTLQQLRSMREMQRIAPKIEALRCKYRDDAMRLQKETMELYKEHKINPLGGCLPMLLQIPVFISFYLVLARSIELKGANFLWIKDLSEPDKLFVLQNINIPFLGNEVNLLPLLMMVASFFQQKLSTSQMASGQTAEQQRLMMFLFPLMFFFFFYHMPSGLVLYWFTNTILTVFQQSAIVKSK